MTDQKLSRNDWKFTALAFLFAGLAYVFVDVALSGVINLYSVIAYMVVLVTVMVLGPVLQKKIQ